MIIKLTNASKDFIGEPLLINSKHILTAFEIKDEVNIEEKVTNIYSVTQQSWIVKEPLETIYNLIKEIA